MGFGVRTEDGTWEPSSGSWGSAGIGGPTGCLTLSTSDHPSEGSVCSLSDILEAHVPPKFFLSPKACHGILRRAARRGKALPDELRMALEVVAEEWSQEPLSPESAEEDSPEPTEPQLDT